MGTARRRKVQDEQEARELLEQLHTGDLNLPEFCAIHGVDGRSLSCWRRNLARRGARTSDPAPQRLRLVEVVHAEPRQPPAMYRLWVGDVTIEVDDHFDDHTLARLLRLVASC